MYDPVDSLLVLIPLGSIAAILLITVGAIRQPMEIHQGLVVTHLEIGLVMLNSLGQVRPQVHQLFIFRLVTNLKICLEAVLLQPYCIQLTVEVVILNLLHTVQMVVHQQQVD